MSTIQFQENSEQELLERLACNEEAFHNFWEKALSNRKSTGTLGKLGGCAFEELEPFVQRALQQQQQPSIEYDHIKVVRANSIPHLLYSLTVMGVLDKQLRWVDGNMHLVVIPGTVPGRRDWVDIVQFLHFLDTEGDGKVTLLLGCTRDVLPECHLPACELLMRYMARFCPVMVRRHGFIVCSRVITPDAIAAFPQGDRDINTVIREALGGGVVSPDFVRALLQPQSPIDNYPLLLETVFAHFGLDIHDGHVGMVVGSFPSNDVRGLYTLDEAGTLELCTGATSTMVSTLNVQSHTMSYTSYSLRTARDRKMIKLSQPKISRV